MKRDKNPPKISRQRGEDFQKGIDVHPVEISKTIGDESPGFGRGNERGCEITEQRGPPVSQQFQQFFRVGTNIIRKAGDRSAGGGDLVGDQLRISGTFEKGEPDIGPAGNKCLNRDLTQSP